MSHLLLGSFSIAQEALLDNPKDNASTYSPNSVFVENAILKTIQSADVAVQVSGVLAELSVQEGDTIAAGALLGKVQDEAVLLQVERARIAMETSKLKQQSNIDWQLATKSSAVAINELQRALKANQRVPDTYPTTEIDRLQLVADRSKLEIERTEQSRALLRMDVQSAENELRIAEELVKRHRIVAPTAGTIVAVDKHPGEWVELGGRLLQIISTERLRIEGFVDLKLISDFQKGALADVRVLEMGTESEAEKSRMAKVVFVAPDANSLNGKVRVFLEIENRQAELRPGQRVDVRIRRIDR